MKGMSLGLNTIRLMAAEAEELQTDVPLNVPDINPGNPWAMLGYVFVILVVIIILIVGLIKFLAYKSGGVSSKRAVKSLSGIQLGQNKSLQLIEIGSKIYVIGVGDQVSFIDKIEHPDEISIIKASLLQHTEKVESFQDIFNRKIKQITTRKGHIEEVLHETIEHEREKL